MQDFIWDSFIQKIAIKANLEDIYDAWTMPSELEKWFLKEALFFKENGEKVGFFENISLKDTYEWSWFLYDAVENGKIIALNEINFIRFSFAGNCLVDINLAQLDDHVMVTLTQHEIPTDDKSKMNIRLGCATGWAFFLVNLKSVYEGGLDLRNKNESLKQMINN